MNCPFCRRLEEAGKHCYEFRAQLMIDNNEGLTKTYNRFHNPEDMSPGIVKLRELHREMDAATCAAYGWTDIPLEYGFYPEPDGKPGLRYRWSDEVCEDVLGRLMALNKLKYEEEVAERRAKAAAEHLKKKAAGKTKRRRPKRKKAPKPKPVDPKRLFKDVVDELRGELFNKVGRTRRILINEPPPNEAEQELAREQMVRAFGEDVVRLATDEYEGELHEAVERCVMPMAVKRCPDSLTPEETQESAEQLAIGTAVAVLAPERFEEFLSDLFRSGERTLSA